MLSTGLLSLGIADAAHGGLDACFRETFRVADGQVLHTSGRCGARDGRCGRAQSSCCSASRVRSFLSDRNTRQRAILRENASITNTTYTKPTQVTA
jgi:hypothetical protein